MSAHDGHDLTDTRMKRGLLLFMNSCISLALAQSPGTFTSTGNMTTDRVFHTATLLNSGKVLIAGGSGADGARASAELYDPSTETFSPTGSMAAPRANHSAALLPDGRVLIAGGDDAGTAELYDPATRSFRFTGNMATVHRGATATMLNSGKVLITGTDSGELAELYDSVTGTFTPVGRTSACSPAATLLPDGKVLLPQGSKRECNDEAYPDFNIYDPDSGMFRPLAWPLWRDDVAGTTNLLPNGKVLMILQAVECDYGGEGVLYDSSNAVFTHVGKGIETCLPTGTLLPDGTLLIANGDSLSIQAEIYDPVSGVFSRTGDMTTVRGGNTATLLNDGTVLFAGGGVFRTPSATAEIYRPPALGLPPVLWSISGDGQGAILHASTHQVVSPDNPAVIGEALEIYLTGLLENSVIPPQVSIGGRLAEVLFFGKAPGYDGLNQINVLVPSGILSGPAAPVRLNYLNRPSNEVTIALN